MSWQEMRQRASEQLQFECVCSFLEVYNESIYDLLQPNHVSLPVSNALKGALKAVGCWVCWGLAIRAAHS